MSSIFSPKGFRPEEASLVHEDDLVGSEASGVLEAGSDVLRPQLRICSKNDLARLPGGEFFENQIRDILSRRRTARTVRNRNPPEGFRSPL